jgi:hypothetical protein
MREMKFRTLFANCLLREVARAGFSLKKGPRLKLSWRSYRKWFFSYRWFRPMLIVPRNRRVTGQWFFGVLGSSGV